MANDPSASDRAIRRLPLIAISVTGFASSLGQILILRELLVLFYGNELSTGLVFTSWLLWTAAGSGIAGRWSHRITPSGNTLSLLLVLLAILLPATLCWIRATRVLLEHPAGRTASPGQDAAHILFQHRGFLFALGIYLCLCLGTAGKTVQCRAGPAHRHLPGGSRWSCRRRSIPLFCFPAPYAGPDGHFVRVADGAAGRRRHPVGLALSPPPSLRRGPASQPFSGP